MNFTICTDIIHNTFPEYAPGRGWTEEQGLPASHGTCLKLLSTHLWTTSGIYWVFSGRDFSVAGGFFLLPLEKKRATIQIPRAGIFAAWACDSHAFWYYLSNMDVTKSGQYFINQHKPRIHLFRICIIHEGYLNAWGVPSLRAENQKSNESIKKVYSVFEMSIQHDSLWSVK